MSALEGATSGESAPQETAATEAALPDHLSVATSSTITGIHSADIPLPEVTEVSSKPTEPVVSPPETVSKEAKEARPSEPTNPTAKPTSGEAESETVKPPSGETTTGEPKAAPKAKDKSVSTRKPRAPKQTPEEEETPEQKEDT